MKRNEKWIFGLGVILACVILALGPTCGGNGGDDGDGDNGPTITYSISGHVTSMGDSFADVTITLSGNSSGTTTTDAEGIYSFSDLSGGSYTVTPSLSGHNFNPSSQNVTISDSDQEDIDFAEDFSPSIVITSPTALNNYSTKGLTLDISGIASDDVSLTDITWTNDQGGSGTATGTTAWAVADIPLQSGDNLISVTATDSGGNTASDSLTVAYNPNLEFLSTPVAEPDAIFVDEQTPVIFRIAIENNPNLDKSSVTLLQVDADNNVIGTLTALADDGNVDNGDDIASDGVFSGIASLTETTEGFVNLRVSADTIEASGTVTALSEVFNLSVITHITDVEFTTAVNMPDTTKQKYDEFEADDADTAAEKTAEWLETQPEVSQAGTSESGLGVWYVLDSGVLGGIILNPEGTRGSERPTYVPKRPLTKTNVDYKASQYLFRSGKELFIIQSWYAPDEPEVGSTKVLIIAPFHTAFGTTSEVNPLKTMFEDSECPTFEVTVLTDGAADVAAFKTLKNYGIISIVSHGDTFYNGLFSGWQDVFGWNWWGGQVIILTGEKATEATKAAYEQDLKKGRLVITGGGYYAVTPAFISYYNKSFPNSAVHAGTCRSTYNNSMASAFIGNGAMTYTGYSDYVASSYAHDTAITNWTSLVSGGTTSEALNDAVAAHGAHDGSGAYLELAGSSNLVISGEGILNGTFEDGNINGWTGVGDVRVIPYLGPLSPAEGAYMSIISTGLGSIMDSDSYVEQTFCIPADATTLSFDYNVVSEEPMEWVGTEFDDQFEGGLLTQDGTLTIVAYESINSSAWTAVGGIDFYGGDDTTYMTGWKHVTIDVTALAGGPPVTLYFNTWDLGDSIYDTAALIDNVKID